MNYTPRFTIAATLLVVAFNGCSTVEIAGRKPPPRADAKHPASRCLCLWQQVNGQADSGESTRGFGGQIYFFTAESETPVTVDGDVHVFMFDDHGTPEEQSRPIYEAHFAAFELQQMLHESQFGPVYSLFVPYPRAGGFEANCSLRVRLTRPDGTHLFSELTPVKLVGFARSEKQAKGFPVDARREQQWASDQTSRRDESGIRVETIGVRRGNRLIATAGEQAEPTGTIVGPDRSTGQNGGPDADARVQYYEGKLRSILQERAAQQSATNPQQHARELGTIRQSSYEEPANGSFSGRYQPSRSATSQRRY